MLKEGDKVPAGLLRTSFESLVPGRQPGETVALADLAPAGKTLVLYFYPKDSTPGCTRQAQGFTASRKAIEKAGGVVVGVSRDSVKSHCSFRDKFGLAIPLLTFFNTHDADLTLNSVQSINIVRRKNVVQGFIGC